MMHLRYLLPTMAAAVALFFSCTVSAAEVAEKKTDEGYGYEFRDDRLLGDSAAAQAPLIRLRRRGLRRTLIRPRVHFVPELLKSVEKI